MKKELIIKWAEERGILSPNNHKAQFIKTIEETGELAAALLKNDKKEIIDAVGDIQITLIILCAQLNISYDACLESAWNEIKDRKGKTENGTFIKNND